MRRKLFVSAAAALLVANGAVATADAGATEGRTLPVDAMVDDPGFYAFDQVTCHPENPGLCEVWFTSRAIVTGTWEGTVLYRGHGHYNVTTGSLDFVKEDFVFTGAVAGCGSGTMSFRVEGTTGTPGPEGIPFTEDLKFKPGTGTGGLAGVVDASGTEAGFIDPTTFASKAPVKGTLWCR